MVILLVIVGISVLILIHEFGHFLVAKKIGLLVEEFGIGFPPRLLSKKIGETVYSINVLPFGGFVKIYGENPNVPPREDGPHRSEEGVINLPADGAKSENESRAFYSASASRRIIVLVAGVAMNFILGWFTISAIFMIGVPSSLVITNVMSESPAALAGFQLGDQLIDFKKSVDFIGFVEENKGKEIQLDFIRNGEKLSLAVMPRLMPPAGEGALGIAFAEAGLEKQSLFLSFWEGIKASLGMVVMIAVSLFQLLLSLFTEGRILEGFVGPIGIFSVANQAAGLGLVYLFQLLALISFNLFVLNLLPFPALDGGRIFFVFLEKIKGRPLSPNFERSANAIGFLVLLFLMIAITVRDLIKLF